MSRRTSASRRRAAAPGSPSDGAFEDAMIERYPKPEPWSMALRLVSLALVFGLTWYAIRYRGATAGALLLPIAGELVAGTAIAVALALFVVREAAYRREVFNSLRFWLFVLVVFALWTWFRAGRDGVTVAMQWARIANDVFDYIARQGMLWPMLAAGAGLVMATAGDVSAYRRKGPPFVHLGSLNLGLRLFVLIVVGMGLLVTVDMSRRQRAEVMWLVLLAGELFALWAPWAVQKRIAEERAKRAKA